MQHCFPIKFNYYVVDKHFLLTQRFFPNKCIVISSLRVECCLCFVAIWLRCDTHHKYTYIIIEYFGKCSFIHFSIFPCSLFNTAGTCVVFPFLRKTNVWLDICMYLSVKMYSPRISKSRLF